MDAPAWFTDVVEKARDRARKRVEKLRIDHPGEHDVDLGKRLVKSSANRAGWTGAVTGTLALITLPVGLPAGIAASLFLEAELIFGLLELYGLETEGESGRLRLYALWAGAGFADAAKSVGLRTGARAIGNVLRESLPGQIIRRLNPALIKAILKRLGLGWVPRAMKLWPILGAPIAFMLDRAALQTLGDATLATLDDEARRKAPGLRRQASGKRRRRVRVVVRPA